MCRHAAYLGPGIAASELLCDLDHSLTHQSYQARELLTGVVCADGYGFGWFDPDRSEAARYAYPGPIWSDPNLASTAPSIRSTLLMAAVRNATVAGSNTHANCAPFQDGPYLFSLNGFLTDYPTAWNEAIDSWLPKKRGNRLKGNTDAEHLFQILLARLEESEGGPADLPNAVQGLVRDVLAYAASNGLEAHLNLLVSDGKRLVATRAGTSPTQNSLYLLQDGDEFPGAHLVASEPLYDDPLWEPVNPDTVLVLQQDAPPVRLRA